MSDLRRKLAQRVALGTEIAGNPATPSAEAPISERLRLEPEVKDRRLESPAYRARVERLQGMLSSMIARQQADVRTTPRSAVPVELSRRGALKFGPLPGTETLTPYGRLHLVRNTFPPDHAHGKSRVIHALSAEAEIIAKLALDEELSGLDPRRFLYLDTETTGLNGGTGTIPFLVGLAWFEDESLCVEQMVLKTPAQERAMLMRLLDKMKQASAFVTFNGKSYDWPLIQSRFVMNRMPVPEALPHVDLLHAARRVYKRRLGEVRLVSLERALLGFRREHDIEGHEIPNLYWSMLRGGESSLLTPVLEHNVNDIVALAALLGIMADRYKNLRKEDDPTDHLGLAHVARRAADLARAKRFAEAAAEGGGDPNLTVEALVLSARLVAKDGAIDHALRLYHRALKAAPDDVEVTAPIHLALAKLYEHRLKDPARALEHAAQAELAEPYPTHARRLERLQARAAKAVVEVRS
ncbi:MAG: ribonuclease H-like domain-containing protein [Myxococcota bacterium]